MKRIGVDVDGTFTDLILVDEAADQFSVPSSGGYGDPLEREPARVLSDVLDDFTTVELARESYGVVIDAKTLTLDSGATELLRAEQRAALVAQGAGSSARRDHICLL